MSGCICGSEWAALSMTQHRRISADKWIRSVTVTVASGGLALSVRQNGRFVRWDAELTFDTTYTQARTHTRCLVSHILSLQTQLLSEFHQFCPFFGGKSWTNNIYPDGPSHVLLCGKLANILLLGVCLISLPTLFPVAVNYSWLSSATLFWCVKQCINKHRKTIDNP